MAEHQETAPTPQQTSADFDRRLVCGYPKTGRTWLRYMIGVALSEEFDLGVEVDLTNVYSIVPNETSTHIEGQPEFAYQGKIPKIEMSHKHYSARDHNDARIVFMTRDPRDVMVSHWLHDSLQVKIFDGSLSDYIRSPERGIAAFLRHLESWSPHLGPKNIVSYEAMRKKPAARVGDILADLGVTVATKNIETAVARGEIGRMREIEVKHGIAGHDYDRTNPEARRVRAGKVGGFIDYLRPSDLDYIDIQIDEASLTTKGVLKLTPYAKNQA